MEAEYDSYRQIFEGLSWGRGGKCNLHCSREQFLMGEFIYKKKKKVNRKGKGEKKSTLHKEKITFRLNPGRKWRNELASSVSVLE